MKKHPIRWIGVGDLLREQIKLRTEIGREVEGIMKTGGMKSFLLRDNSNHLHLTALVGDSVVIRMVEPQIHSIRDEVSFR
jgi:hypothetical protein